MKVLHAQLPLWLLISTTAVASPVSDRQRRQSISCTIERGVDHFGGDYEQLQISTFDGCLAACQQDPSCVTAQYTADDDGCYLKNTLNPATADARVDSAVCRPPASGGPTTTTTTIATSSTTMTTSTTAATTTSAGSAPVTCQIVPNTDYFGGDYESIPNVSFDACVQACEDDDRCITAQFAKSSSVCYLKSTLTTPTPDADVDTALCRAPQSDGASSMTTTTTAMMSITTTTSTPVTSTTTTMVTTTSQAATIGTCSIVRDTDYFGSDYGSMYYPTFDLCAQACQDDYQCVTAQYDKTSNICYFKSVLPQPSSNTRIDSVICRPPSRTSTTTSASSASTPPCTIIRMTDYYGGDYDSFPASSLDECIQACQLDSQCIDTQFHSGYSRCYLKDVLTTPSDNPQVDTAICRTSGTTTSSSMTTTSTTTAAATTTTTIVTTTTTTSLAPRGTVCYSVTGQASDPTNAFSLNAILTVNLDSPCTDMSRSSSTNTGGSGFKIVSTRGVLNNGAISFDPTAASGGPDYCLYTSSTSNTFLSLDGTNIIVDTIQYNLFSDGPNVYAESSGPSEFDISLVFGPQVPCTPDFPKPTSTTTAITTITTTTTSAAPTTTTTTTPALTTTTTTMLTSTTTTISTTTTTTITAAPTTTTTIVTTTTTTSLAPRGTVCYSVTGQASNPTNAFSLNAILTVNLDSPCTDTSPSRTNTGGSGFKIVNTHGVLNNGAISFDPTGTAGGPDYCLYTSSTSNTFLSLPGTNIIVNTIQYNLYSSGPNAYGELSAPSQFAISLVFGPQVPCTPDFPKPTSTTTAITTITTTTTTITTTTTSAAPTTTTTTISTTTTTTTTAAPTTTTTARSTTTTTATTTTAASTTTTMAACTPTTVTSPDGPRFSFNMAAGQTTTFTGTLQASGLCPGKTYSFMGGRTALQVSGGNAASYTQQVGSSGYYDGQYAASSSTETDSYSLTVMCSSNGACAGNVYLQGFTATPVS